MNEGKYTFDPRKVLFVSRELPTTVNVQTTKFQSDKFLEDKVVVSIEAFSVSDVGKTPKGVTTVGATAFKNSFLQIRRSFENRNVLDNVPLSRFQPSSNNGVTKNVFLQDISWMDCLVYISDASALSSSEAYLFTFGYICKDDLIAIQ